MNVLVILESLALITAAWLVWRRTPVDEPRYGRVIARMTFALALQLGLVILAGSVLNKIAYGADPTRGLVPVALGVLTIQVARAAVIGWAVAGWLRIVKPRLARSWRGVLLLIGLVIVTLESDLGFLAAMFMLLPLFRVRFVSRAHGWTRVLLVFVFGLLVVSLAGDASLTMSEGRVASSSLLFGSQHTVAPLDGDLSGPAAAIVDVTRPFGYAVRTMIFLLQLQLAVGFFQLLVFPIRLRGLSLKRRFTVTLAMYRFIPGTLGFAFLLIVIYVGIGLHRAGVVRSTFEGTVEDGLEKARALLEQEENIADRRTHRYATIRELEWVPAAADTGAGAEAGDSTDAHWAAVATVASPGTPAAILQTNYFGLIEGDSVAGFVERDGTLYLRAAELRRTGGTARAAEVFTVIDPDYLADVAQRVSADVRLDVSPNIFIDETSVTIGKGNEQERAAWADSSFTVQAPFVREVTRDDFWERKFYLARTFIPMGNWFAPLGESGRIGAVQLKLDTTLRGLYESLTRDTYTMTSQVFAIVVLMAIGLLFLIVELSAVRTGRSIIKGIVTDVGSLTDAAKRFGQGDLQYRVALAGKDEMGRLADTFNRMATNIEAHQEVLLEKERLEADLAVARDIQQRMLPQSPPSVPGLDVAGLSIPSREVGGDLFYFLPLSGGRLGLTVGDVSGKSVPAALLMSNVLAALKSEARLVDEEDEIVAHLNRLIIDQVEPGRFVTFFYGVVDPGAKRLRYACAGHNPPLLMRASGDAQWLEEAGAPLGVVPESTYTPVEATLEAGDVLVLYSDGVTEAQRDSDAPTDDDAPPDPDTFFDEHRLESAVHDVRDKSATEIVGRVMDAIRDFTGGAEQSDDLTLVVVRVTE